MGPHNVTCDQTQVIMPHLILSQACWSSIYCPGGIEGWVDLLLLLLQCEGGMYGAGIEFGFCPAVEGNPVQCSPRVPGPGPSHWPRGRPARHRRLQNSARRRRTAAQSQGRPLHDVKRPRISTLPPPSVDSAATWWMQRSLGLRPNGHQNLLSRGQQTAAQSKCWPLQCLQSTDTELFQSGSVENCEHFRQSLSKPPAARNLKNDR